MYVVVMEIIVSEEVISASLSSKEVHKYFGFGDLSALGRGADVDDFFRPLLCIIRTRLWAYGCRFWWGFPGFGPLRAAALRGPLGLAGCSWPALGLKWLVFGSS